MGSRIAGKEQEQDMTNRKLLIVCMLASLLAGCGNSYPVIEGNWNENVEGGMVLELSKDTMYVTMGKSRAIYGKYRFIDKNTIEVELSDFVVKAKKAGAEAKETFRKADAAISGEKYTPTDPKKVDLGNVERMTVKLEGDNLTLTNEEGKPTKLTKVK